MSYEGRYQFLCKNGHYFIEADYCGDYDQMEVCPECGELIRWKNSVDDTNYEAYGFIDIEMFLVEHATIEKCDLGHDHVVRRARYRIPSDEEMKQFGRRGRWARKIKKNKIYKWDYR